ncbi:MAG: response regulator [Pseudomonadota bacterium]
MSRILSVDDSVSMRQMIEFTLTSAGFDVTSAVDGEDGLLKASEGSFDLIISDVNMPRMDGIQMIKALRSQKNYQFTPILMLTTESGGDKKQEGKDAGATGWIIKPFDPDKLLNVIKKVLN